MARTNIAPSEPTGPDVQIGLVLEDRRTGDLRQVVYADSRVVLVRDEKGDTTLLTRDSFAGRRGTRYRARRDAAPDIDGGQYERLRTRLAEYERRDGRKAAHKADALREALDLLAGGRTDRDRPATDDDGEAEDDDGEVPFEEIPGVGPKTAGNLRAAGFVTADDVRAAADEAVLAVAGVGPENLEAIREFVD